MIWSRFNKGIHAEHQYALTYEASHNPLNYDGRGGLQTITFTLRKTGAFTLKTAINEGYKLVEESEGHLRVAVLLGAVVIRKKQFAEPRKFKRTMLLKNRS